MSLINKVLHDLEDRHAFPSMQPQSVLADLRSAQEYAQTRGMGTRPVVGLGVLLMLTAAAILLGRDLSAPGVPAARLSVQRAPVAVAGPQVEPRAAKAPATAPAAAPELRLKLDSLALPAFTGATAVTSGTAMPEITGTEPRLLDFAVVSEGDTASIDLVFTQPPRYSLHVLEQPSRLLVQTPHIEMSPLRDLQPAGLVERLRFGGDAGVSKLIFDLNRNVEIIGARIVPGPGDVYRLEVRLAAAGAAREPSADDLPEQGVTLVEEPHVVVAPAMEVVRRAPSPAGTAESAFQQGVAAYRAGDMAAAIDYLHRAVTAEPDHLKARRFLVAVLVDQGDAESAARFAEQGLAHHPQDSVLLRTLARIRFEQGDAPGALNVLARSQPAIQDDPDYYALMAAVLQKQGRHAEAADLYGRLLRLDPRRGLWWGGFGISLEALGRPAEARAAFERTELDASAPADLRGYAAGRVAALRRQPG